MQIRQCQGHDTQQVAMAAAGRAAARVSRNLYQRPVLLPFSVAFIILLLLLLVSSLGIMMTSPDNPHLNPGPYYHAKRALEESPMVSPHHQQGKQDAPLPPLKPLFPFTTKEIAGLFVATLGVLIAAGGGVGAGGMLLPLLMFLFDMPAQYAIAITSCTVFGGAIANSVSAARQRHPLADRPLIDFDLILLMEFMTIGGAILGALAQKMLPPFVITLLLAVVLGAMGTRTMQKGLKQLEREGGLKKLCMKGGQQHQQEEMEQGGVEAVARSTSPVAAADKDDEEPPLPFPLPPKTESALSFILLNEQEMLEQTAIPRLQSSLSSIRGRKNTEEDGEMRILVPSESSTALKQILEKERHIPLWKPFTLLVVVVGVALLSVTTARGWAGKQCTAGWWVSTFTGLPFVILFWLGFRAHVLHETAAKLAAHYPYLENDVIWTPRNTITFPFLSIFAGIFAGMSGIGGGLIKGPLLLEIGILPPVAAMCAAVMVLFTSATATLIYYTFGFLPWEYAVFFFCFGVIFTAIGQALVTYFVKKYKMMSFILLSIGGIVLISVLFIIYRAVELLVQNSHSALQAHGLCS